MEKQLYELDKELCFAREAAETLESAEWFTGDLLETLVSAKHNGMDIIPVEEVLIKVRGIFHLIHNTNKDLGKHLANAHEVSAELDELSETKKEKNPLDQEVK